MQKDVVMFGLSFNRDLPIDSARQLVLDAVNRKKSLVITPNVDHIVTLEKDPCLFRIYTAAEYLFADGQPLVWLSKILPGRSIPKRVTGADLLENICLLGNDSDISLAFIGAKEGVGLRAAEVLKIKYPRLVVRGYYSPPLGFEKSEVECGKIVEMINCWKPDVTVLALGAPKQEYWAYNNMEKLDTGPILCFGAALDFLAGNVTRAPIIFQKFGLEWLWRVAIEPRRLWKRYLLKDPLFFIIAIRELITSYGRIFFRHKT